MLQKIHYRLLVCGMLAVLLAGAAAGNAQQRQLVILHPKVGKVLDRKERDELGLFQSVSGFQSAIFFRLPDGIYQIQISRLGKNHLPETEIWTISADQFRLDYQAVAAAYFSGAGHKRAGGRQAAKPAAPPELDICFSGGERVHGRLTGVTRDSLALLLSGGTTTRAALQDVSAASLVCHAPMKNTAVAALAAGSVGVVIGLASGSDEPGWFSFTAGEKAMILGLGLSLPVLIGPGFIKTIQAVDVDLPLRRKPPEERYRLFREVLNGTYRPSPGFLFSATATALKTPGYGPVGGFEVRMVLIAKPRASVDLVYGQTGWSGTRTVRHVLWEDAYGHGETVELTQIRWHYSGLNATVRRSYGRVFTPVLSWGLWIARRNMHGYIADKSVYHPGPGQTETHIYSDRIRNSEGGLSLNFSLGAEVRLTDFLRAEAHLGLFQSHHLQELLRVGICLGRQP